MTTIQRHHLTRSMTCLLVLASVTAIWAAPKRQRLKLTKPAQAALQKAFPDAEIDEIDPKRRIIQYFVVALIIDGVERDVSITPDGTILAISEEIDVDELPAQVGKALRKLADGSRIDAVDRMEIHAEFTPTPLKKRRYDYEAEIVLGGRKRDVTVSEDGRVLKSSKRIRTKPRE